MIIHKLIGQYVKTTDHSTFYAAQAQDSVEWIKDRIPLFKRKAVDLGCGHGMIGKFLQMTGAEVTFADIAPTNELKPYVSIDLTSPSYESLGTYDLIACSNVYEHLPDPLHFLKSIEKQVSHGGHLYLSWTNWLSPWGGHEFSPFHYLGARLGQRAYDAIVRKPRYHTVGKNLFKTSIGATVRAIREHTGFEVVDKVPRYYPEFSFVLKVPVVREFLTWNCAMLLKRP